MRKISKAFSLFLAVLMLFSVFPTSAFAIDWNGTSSGTPGQSGNAAYGNFNVDPTNNTTACVGYRFSVVDQNGNTVSGKLVDIYREQYSFDYFEKSTTKLNKVDLIKAYNNGTLTFNTNKNTTGCYMQTASDINIELPNPINMGTWQANEKDNLNPVLKKLGYSKGVSDLPYGARLLVEPIWRLTLNSYWQCLTVSEIAAYGIKNSKLGPTSCGGTPDGGKSFGTISYYTNNLWPNALRTGTTAGLSNLPWGATGEINSSNADDYNSYLNGGNGAYRKSFENLLKEGYGIGVGYTQTANKKNSVKVVTKYYGMDNQPVNAHDSNNLYNGDQMVVHLSTSSTTDTNTYNLPYDSTKGAFYKEGITAGTYYIWATLNNTILSSTAKIVYTGESFTITATSDVSRTVTYYYLHVKSHLPLDGVDISIYSPKSDTIKSSIESNDISYGVLKGARLVLEAVMPDNTTTSRYYFDQYTRDDHATNSRTSYNNKKWSYTDSLTGSYQYITAPVTYNAYGDGDTATIYTITCNKQNGTGGTDKFYEVYGLKFTLTASISGTIATSITPPTRTNYEFLGYYTKTGGTVSNGVVSGAGKKVVDSDGTILVESDYWKANATIYAYWKVRTYTVTYVENLTGETVKNMPANQTKTYNVDLTLSDKKPTAGEYSFVGWCTNSKVLTTGTGTWYSPGQVYKTNANLKLYAIWAKERNVYYYLDGTRVKSGTYVEGYAASLYSLAAVEGYVNTPSATTHGTIYTVFYDYSVDSEGLNEKEQRETRNEFEIIQLK